MSLEKERIQFRAHKTRLMPYGCDIIDANTDEVLTSLNPEELAYYENLKEGLNLKQLFLKLSLSSKNFHFHRVYHFIEKMANERLILNPGISQMIERMRPEYRWRKSILNHEVASDIVVRIVRKRNFPALGNAILYLLGVCGLGSMVLFLLHFFEIRNALNYVSVSGSALLQTFILISGVRSLRAILQLLLFSSLRQRTPTLRWVLSPISFHLDCESPVQWSHKSRAEFIIYLATHSVLLWPLVLLKGSSSFLYLLFILLEMSPFIESTLTQSLRYYFNWNIKNEFVFARFHIALNVIWILSFGLLVSESFVSIARSFMAHPVGSLLVSFWFVSYFDDILNSFVYGSDVDRSLIRQYWLKKSAELSDRNYDVEPPTYEKLADLPLIRQFPEEIRKQLLQDSNVIRVPAGVRICRQGSAGRDLFFLLSGRAAVIRRSQQHRQELLTVLEAGSIFGETGFFMGKARTADVTMLEAGKILCIKHRPDFQDIQNEKSTQIRDRVWFLQALNSSPLFRQLPSEVFDKLLYFGQVVKFKSLQTVMNEGELGDRCYFIVQGEANVFQKGQQINRMGKGDLFGEIALLLRSNVRTATVVAAADLILVELTRDHFWEVLCSNLPLALSVERIAMERYRREIEA